MRRHQSASGTQRGPCRQYGSPHHALRAANQQGVPIGSFVGKTATGQYQFRYVPTVRIIIRRPCLSFIVLVQFDRQNNDFAGSLPRLGQQQRQLRELQRQRNVGIHDLAPRIAVFGQHSRRQVDRNHPAAEPVDKGDRAANRLREPAADARTEQSVDRHRILGNFHPIHALHPHAVRQPFEVVAALDRQLPLIEQNVHGTGIPHVVQHARNRQAVSAVVSFSDKKSQRLLLRNVVANPLGDHFRSPFHQRETLDRFVFDRILVGLAYLRSCQNFHRIIF